MKYFEKLSCPLIILDMANNHNGSIEHGKKIIDEIFEVVQEFNFRVAIKFQYRHLDSFIHESYKGNQSLKYIKRFEETRLSDSDFIELVKYVRKKDFLVACTPFDEISVDKIVEQDFDILKIASVSLTDWPLLNRIAKQNLPVVASTGGANIKEIDKTVKFLSKRVTDLALMHCVSTYPTPNNQLNLNRIDNLRLRYEPIVIGYSTHENPYNFDAVKIALAKGAKILERHVGSSSNSQVVNSYSSDKALLIDWFKSIEDALEMVGHKDALNVVSESEIQSLHELRRGVYSKVSIKKEEILSLDNVYFAVPFLDGQLSANNFSDFSLWKSKFEFEPNAPLFLNRLVVEDLQNEIERIAESTMSLLKSAHIVLPKFVNLEISHHYGLENFDKFGLVMITLINREYCKKILVLKPGQSNPEHYHNLKEETFYCIYGQVKISLNSKITILSPGASLLVPVGVKHSIFAENWAVLEEISTQIYEGDSYYTDEKIHTNLNRKSHLSIWP